MAAAPSAPAVRDEPAGRISRPATCDTAPSSASPRPSARASRSDPGFGSYAVCRWPVAWLVMKSRRGAAEILPLPAAPRRASPPIGALALAGLIYVDAALTGPICAQRASPVVELVAGKWHRWLAAGGHCLRPSFFTGGRPIPDRDEPNAETKGFRLRSPVTGIGTHVTAVTKATLI
jgi:hypothetical protein